MNLKVIALADHKLDGSTARRFLAGLSKELDFRTLPNGETYMPRDLYSINFKAYDWIVESSISEMKVAVDVLEIHGYFDMWLDDFLKLVEPGCAWDIIYSPKTYDPNGDPTLRSIFIDKECIHDDIDLDIDKSGAGELPLEYFFAKRFLVEHHMKRDLFPDTIKIDERYDLAKIGEKHDLAKYESRTKKATAK